jgi:hypothetical protein
MGNDIVDALEDQFSQGCFARNGGNLGLLEKLVGKIDCCLRRE